MAYKINFRREVKQNPTKKNIDEYNTLKIVVNGIPRIFKGTISLFSSYNMTKERTFRIF